MASNKCDENVIPFVDVDATEADSTEEDSAKKKKKKDETTKENTTSKLAQARSTARTYLVGTKPPGPASKTGVPPLSKQSTSSQGGTSTKAAVSSSKSSSSVQGMLGKTSNNQMQHKTANSNQCNQTKVGTNTSNKSLSTNSQANKTLDTRKSPCPSPKPSTTQKDAEGYDGDEAKLQESTGPKVPPLKIVIPGGVGSAASSSHQQEGDGSSGQRSGSKSQSNSSTLPYVMPFNAGNADSSEHHEDGKDDKKHSDDKAGGSGQRVLRSHRTTDGEKEKDLTSSDGGPANNISHSSKSPPPQSLDTQEAHSSKDHLAEKRHSTHGSVDLHPRKRKIKASKDQSHHAQAAANDASHHQHHASLNEAMNIHISHNSNPYQMYLNIRRQVDRKHKGLFPVQPKPPEGFDDYLMNKCTYVLSHTVKATPVIVPPVTLTEKLHEEYKSQEKQRNRLRIQHVVEKEKLVLAVEQEILRVHGRAARALANQYVDFQTCPFSVCTMLRNSEIYSLQTPEQEEKERNAAQRSRYNGRLFLSWLQDVDDKWDKIKEGMVRRHHTEAESLHAMQRMMWGWKMKELALCDYKTSPSIDETHVPMVHVSDDFDLLPA